MNRLLYAATVVAMLLLCPACEDGLFSFDWTEKQDDKDIEDKIIRTDIEGLEDSLAYQDTIAEQGWFEGLRMMRVRGYGVVVGLGRRGSGECPPSLRRRLIQEMHKRGMFSGKAGKPSPISPGQFLDDLDTAVVIVEGEIPAAAAEGASFDVMVRALPGTQTVSLEGGLLVSTDLHIYRDSETGSPVEGKILATAAGPVFLNPFTNTNDSTAQRNVRQGTVIGGGMTNEARRVRYVLSRPSYQRVRQISRRINGRFPSTPDTAEAVSPSYITVNIPPAFKDDPFRFLALTRHLYLPERPGFLEERAQALTEEIRAPDALHPDIAIAWEGIGRSILPIIQGLYADPLPHVSFYSALAGMRLGDDMAVEVIGKFARDPDSQYRITAIDALGYANLVSRASSFLRQLLDDSDPRIRVQAYESLLVRNDPIINTIMVGNDGFFLDSVPCAAENTIYVRRTGARRIVLLGSNIQCKPPVFYRDPNGLLTLNADTGATSLTLVRKTVLRGRTSPPLNTPLDVTSLARMLGDEPVVKSVDDVHGLALDYSFITSVLYELCQSGSINAKFMMQQRSVTDIFGPVRQTGREESEL